MQKDYIWNSAGSFLQSALSPLLLLIVTRINGIEASGLFSFALAVSLVFWTISLWGGRTYQVSDSRGEFLQQSYVMVRIILSIVMIVGALLFGYINNYDPTKWTLIMVLVVFKASESLSDALYGILQREGRLYIAGISLVLKSLGGILLFCVVDILTKNLILGAMAIVAVNVLIILTYDLRHLKSISSKDMHANLMTVFHQALSIIKRCAPVAIVLILSMFSLNIPRYFLDIYHESEIGYFGILAMPVTLIGLFVVFILQPNITKLSSAFVDLKLRNFQIQVYKIMLAVVAVGSVILLATAAIGVPVLSVLFGVDFAPYDLPLIILVFGGIMNAVVTVLINILTIVRLLVPQMAVLLLTNLFLAIASYIYVPIHGVMAAVGLFAITNTLQAFILYAIYKIRITAKGTSTKRRGIVGLYEEEK